MSGGGNEESWEAWFPKLEDAEAEHFKWGWNSADGEVVWRVGGPGDGLPAHAEQLRSTWGRAPNSAAGDVLGVAFLYAKGFSDENGAREIIEIDAYYGRHVPASVIDWFERAFPGALLRPSSV